MDTCEKNIQQFLDRNIGTWTGLEAGCKEEDLKPRLSFNPGEGATYRGIDNVAYTFRSLIYRNFVEGVVFHFNQDLLSFIATDYWSFDQQECADIVRQLGEPAHRLEFCWRNEKIGNGEWAYTDKGISVGIIPATQLIASVMVYPPCTLSAYKAKYYNPTLAREFRSRE